MIVRDAFQGGVPYVSLRVYTMEYGIRGVAWPWYEPAESAKHVLALTGMYRHVRNTLWPSQHVRSGLRYVIRPHNEISQTAVSPRIGTLPRLVHNLLAEVQTWQGALTSITSSPRLPQLTNKSPNQHFRTYKALARLLAC